MLEYTKRNINEFNYTLEKILDDTNFLIYGDNLFDSV